MKFLKIALLVCVFFSVESFAKSYNKKKDSKYEVYKKCIPTKKHKVDRRPAKFASDNDLTRVEGGFFDSYNQKIIIRGVVKDKNCVPVSNAQIRLWQVDSYGKKRYEEQHSTKHQKYTQDKLSYSKFQGTGMFTSLNNGEFFFITVRPSELSKSKKDPKYINFEINHADYPKVANRIYFLEAAQFSNKDNIILAKNFFSTRFKDIKIYDMEIVLDGVSPHSKF
ncbi:MAG: hypothetical protein RLN62_01935 [Rickettsiales bacterium]